MWRPDALAAVGEGPQRSGVGGEAEVAMALARDALPGAAVGAAVHPAQRKEVLGSLRRGDPDRRTEGVPGDPLAAEVADQQLAQVAAHRVAVLVVPLEALHQVVDEEQLVASPGERSEEHTSELQSR